MKTVTTTIILALLTLLATRAPAQERFQLKGKILQLDKTPLAGAVVRGTKVMETTVTNAGGEFTLELSDPDGGIYIEAAGFYPRNQPLLGRHDIQITLVPTDRYRYNEELVMPFRLERADQQTSAAVNVSKKDLGDDFYLDRAMAAKVPGLRVIKKSGMPGEGAYWNLRGTRTFIGDNAPLIVINGIPYMPDSKESPIIGGFSKSLLLPYNVHDIQNVTVLKGAEASLYGSLGSNGVILVETDGATRDQLETRVTFHGQYGFNWNGKTLPLMNVKDYKAYLNNVGLTRYENMADLFTNFPFLMDDPGYYYASIYNNNTDWQKQIYKTTFVTENLFRVEGGDAIAKYDLSLGYTRDQGTVANTEMDKYHAQLNTNVLVSRQWEMYTTVGLAFIQNQLQEQGMIPETNPVLAAYYKAPILSPWRKDGSGHVLNQYDIARLDVSNPLAITDLLDASDKMYDINIKVGATYRPTPALTLNAMLGLYYNYNRENIFIPGVDLAAILPLEDKLAKNTVRTGVGETFNMFYNLNAAYTKTIGGHPLNLNAGYQVLTSRREFDAGRGRNTTNDFYQTLNFVHSEGRHFWGYIDMWNWMNTYLHADYTRRSLRASLNASLDAASSTGPDAPRFTLYPSASITWTPTDIPAIGRREWIDNLRLRAEYSRAGNSRYSSNYGKNYYINAPLMDIGSIVRANIPNTSLRNEKNTRLDIGIETSLLHRRLELTLDYYIDRAANVILANPIASVFGQPTYHENNGKIKNSGLELALRLTPVRARHIEWTIGGHLATINSRVTSLGKNTTITRQLDDGAEIITREGRDPYTFYGYKTDGVIPSTAQANANPLRDFSGRQFAAGDIKFIDITPDGIIDEQDKTTLGTATPDLFGALYTAIRWKKIQLTTELTYSIGNKAYNAVRRQLESGATFNNQTRAMRQRWALEGQITDIPRAVYGDPMNNSRFSSRWVENASYLKWKNITIAYTFDTPVWNIFRSGTLYITGENLHTFTKYLGLDPEFAYSHDEALIGCDYAKMAPPTTIKIGANLKF
ncbi:MAG: SusC/RagA family TonB-linked outer membrane protein [Odoribacteraceae bacterium]|jgi:TonB-linked SusC/RagA family outer membrane protein|nr:SusC/RagA family TonB-linked outer membrane protein [Odoribacteraceae bacterium]